MIALAQGDVCMVSGRGDAGIDPDARPFFREPCLFVKRTKAGLMQVSLQSDPRKLYSFPSRNIYRRTSEESQSQDRAGL
jgi:hypothetical protein